MAWLRFVVVALTLWAAAAPVFAGPGLDPVEALPNAAQEARARALFKELRCVVCQSESLDDSEADLAKDMRRLVRTQVAAGQTDEQIRAYLTGRYGEFVLLKPPARLSTWALWFGPFALLIAVFGTIALVFFRRKAEPEAPLTENERDMLKDDHGNLRKT